MKLIDANVVLQYLVDEDTDRSRRSLAFLSSLATGEEKAILPESVLAEIVYVLASRRVYARTRREIASRPEAIVELRGLQIDSKDAIILALEIFANTTLDFPECVCVGRMRSDSIREIVSYDRHFDRFDDIVRVEPRVSGTPHT